MRVPADAEGERSPGGDGDHAGEGSEHGSLLERFLQVLAVGPGGRAGRFPNAAEFAPMLAAMTAGRAEPQPVRAQ